MKKKFYLVIPVKKLVTNGCLSLVLDTHIYRTLPEADVFSYKEVIDSYENADNIFNYSVSSYKEYSWFLLYFDLSSEKTLVEDVKWCLQGK